MLKTHWKHQKEVLRLRQKIFLGQAESILSAKEILIDRKEMIIERREMVLERVETILERHEMVLEAQKTGKEDAAAICFTGLAKAPPQSLAADLPN